jgi:hypothetical protein
MVQSRAFGLHETIGLYPRASSLAYQGSLVTALPLRVRWRYPVCEPLTTPGRPIAD